MLNRIHAMRKHEEGQALVLASICMLILTLCVLATVNISFAAKEKIRLQNAADSAAYTTAAYQARALNFMAFTNRTMVIQTASQMNMLAMLTYLAFAAIVFNALGYIPYVGMVFQVIATIVKVFVMIMDALTLLLIPIIDGLNWGLGLAQAAISTAIAAQAVTGSAAAATDYNPAYRVNPLGDTLLRLGALKTWMEAVDTQVSPISLSAPDANDRLNRAFMTEITNSARHKWTAYGGKQCDFLTGVLIPRRCFTRMLGILSIGKEARTEWGSVAASGGFMGAITNVTEQLYSIDQFRVEISIFGFGIRFAVGPWAKADRHLGGHEAQVDVGPVCPRLIRRICERALRGVTQPLSQAANAVVGDVGFIPGSRHHFHMGQMPFAKYRPTTGNAMRMDPARYFNQPPTLVMVTLPRAEFQRRGRPFMGRFGARIGTLTGANSNLDARFGTRVGAPPKRGWRSEVDFVAGSDRPLPFMEQGFTAMSAALAYYHRPGDWREPPNLFNPFWGAKLMPVTEFPAIGTNPALRPLVSNQFLVH